MEVVTEKTEIIHKKYITFDEAISHEHITMKTNEYMKTWPHIQKKDREEVAEAFRCFYREQEFHILKKEKKKLEDAITRLDERDERIALFRNNILNQQPRQCVLHPFWEWLTSIPGAIYDFVRIITCC